MQAINNIIRVPERKNVQNILLDVNNQINYWKLYEITYSKRHKFSYDIDKTNISLDQINNFINYIENIKYNYHWCNYEDFEKEVLTKFILMLNNDVKDELDNLNGQIFNLDKKNINIIKLYFKCIDIIIQLDMDKIKNNSYKNKVDQNTSTQEISEMNDLKKELLQNTIVSINNHIRSINLSKIEIIIKINLQLDKYLDIVPDSIKDELIVEIVNMDFSNKLIECFKLDFDKTFSIILQWNSLYNKIVLYNSTLISSKLTDCFFEELLTNKFNQEQYTNSKLAIKCFNIFKLINKHVSNLKETNDLISKNYTNFFELINTQNENFIKYLFASIYEIMNDNSVLILDFIRFQIYNKNKLDFINYYKLYLQKRLLNGSNIEKEEIFIKELAKVFKDNEYKKYIDIIDNCFKDFKISAFINKEMRGLTVVVNNPQFKSSSLDLHKIKLSILSSVLWSNFIQPLKSYKMNIPNNINIYTSLIEKYYDKKYENRSINISHVESVITIKLRKLIVKLPLSNYYVLKCILNNNNIKEFKIRFAKNMLNLYENHNNDYIQFISEKLNMPKDDITEIIDNMVYNKLILISPKAYYVMNVDLCNNKYKIDLTKKINIKEPEQIQEIEFCKEELIDCNLVKIVKKSSVSFGKYIYLLRTSLKNMFIPNDEMVKKRINKLMELEYIQFSDNKYHYIP